jgi:RND superfamily putative drug exporter
MNLATHLGRWSAHHPWRAIGAWIAFVVCALVIGSAVGTRNLSDADQAVGESGKAERILDRADFQGHPDETVLIKSSTATVHDPAFAAAVRDVARTVSTAPHVTDVRTPFGAGGRSLVSKDGHAALVTFQLDVGDDGVHEVAPVLEKVETVAARHPHLQIAESGDASLVRDVQDHSDQNMQQSRLYSFGLTLAILVVAFGGLLIAGVPVLLAFSAVAAATGLLAGISHFSPTSDTAAEIVILIGMAVGVDYSLFYVTRQRAERAAGRSRREAVDVAAATSGRAVLVSGLTVIGAMAGMYLAGQAVFVSVGTATIVVVAAAVAGSLTVLPAILAGPPVPNRLQRLGRAVARPFRTLPGRIVTFPFRLVFRLWRGLITAPHRLGGSGREGGFVGRLVGPAVRRPKAALAFSTGLLVALALPALTMHVALPGMEALDQSLPSVKTHNAIERAFPGQPAPAVVVVRAANVKSGPVLDGITKLRTAALETGEMHQPITLRQVDRQIVEVLIPLAGSGTDRTSQHALATLRQHVVPGTIGAVPGVQAYTTGETAGTTDFNQLMKARAPYVIGFVLVLAFVLLLVTFRSLVIPLKAIVLNLLSVAAAYGVLVAVFQHHWAEGILGFHENGAITAWLPIFLFVILFGLSMDYHVFILSRVKELVDRGTPTKTAVEQAITATAGVVTSAAIVMVAVFGIFAILPDLELKQAGVGLASAILIDATIVRAVLLPAAMVLLGERNWYLPRVLGFLPRVEHERLPPLPRRAPSLDRAGA